MEWERDPNPSFESFPMSFAAAKSLAVHRRPWLALCGSRVAGALLLAVVSAPAFGQTTVIWNPGNTFPTTSGTSGVWSTAAANWSNGSSNSAWNNTNQDIASFDRTSTTSPVTLGSDITVQRFGTSVSSFVTISNTGGNTFAVTIVGATNSNVIATGATSASIDFNVPVVFSTANRSDFLTSTQTLTRFNSGIASKDDSGEQANITLRIGGSTTISGVSTYSGVTSLEGSNRTLTLGNDQALGSSRFDFSSTSSTNFLQASGGMRTLANEIRLTGYGSTASGKSLTISGTNDMVFNGNVTLAPGEGSSVFLNVSSSAKATFNGTFSEGNASVYTLTKGGTGTLALNGANTFRGRFTVGGGTVEIATLTNSGNASPLGTNAAIDLGSGASTGILRFVNTAPLSTNRGLQLAGTTGGGGFEANGSADVTLGNVTNAVAGTKTFILTGTSTAVNSIGSIIGAGVSMNKTGSGVWRLTESSSFDGRLTVLGGTIVAAAGADPDGNGVFGSGTGDSVLPVIGDESAGATGQAAVLLESDVSIFRGLVIAPLGSGANQSVTLGTSGTAGTAIFGRVGASSDTISLGQGRDLTLQAATGGTVRFQNKWTGVSGTGTPPAVAFNVGSAGNDGTVVFASVIPEELTAVNVRRGTLRLEGLDETIYRGTPVTLGETGFGATLDVNGIVQPLSRLSFAGLNSTVTGTGTLGVFDVDGIPAVTVNGTGHTITTAVTLDNATTFAVTAGGRLGISGVISGTAGNSLTKTGPGILELTGANTYTGPTAVSEGTLIVNGALGNTAVSVGLGGRFGGTGSLDGSLFFAAGSFLDVVDLDTALTVTGSTTFGSGFGIGNLAGIDWDALLLDTPYPVLNTTQQFSVENIDNFGFANRVSVGSNGREAYFVNGSLQVIVVPEPGALAVAAIGLAATAWAARRRR